MRCRLLPLVCSALTLFLLAGCSGGSSAGSPSVTPADNPAPTIASISPPSILAGSPSQTLTLTGTGYISSTVAALNGTAACRRLTLTPPAYRR